jgi:hypothetical protein
VPYFGSDFERSSHFGEIGVGEMLGYAKRRMPRAHPSELQRKFLELLQNLGPRDNAQTGAVCRATKRACQVRGWVEWKSLDDNFPDSRAWHLTIIGRKTLNRGQAALPTAIKGVIEDHSIAPETLEPVGR